MLGELDRGIQSLTKANTLEPENKTVISELAKHKKKLEQQKEAQKKMYRRMLGTQDPKKSPDGFSIWVSGCTINRGCIVNTMSCEFFRCRA